MGKLIIFIAYLIGFERIFKHFDSENARQRQAIHEALEAENILDVRKLLTNCTYVGRY